MKLKLKLTSLLEFEFARKEAHGFYVDHYSQHTGNIKKKQDAVKHPKIGENKTIR